jgi:hypothetical protein
MSETRSVRDRMLEDGFCVLPRILPQRMVDRLRVATEDIWADYTDEQRKAAGGQGSIAALPYLPEVFSELIAWPGAIAALNELGFDHPRYWSGYIIAKDPHSPPSYWHQDWPFWEDPISADREPQQIFLMYYLTDTTIANGCLRAIPGSNLKWCPQHELGGHDEGTRHEDPATHPAYADSEDQVDVCVSAGDLVVGDSRLLHGPRGNGTDERRTVITMWYLTHYDNLRPELQAAFYHRLNMPPDKRLSAEWLERLKPLVLENPGEVSPLDWNRDPRSILKG